MKYNITIDNNKYIQKFFNKYSSFEEDIKNNIYNILPEIIDLKRNGLTIFEYKIVVNNNNFRAGYTLNGSDIDLFYITKTTIKREFVKELEGTDLVDWF